MLHRTFTVLTLVLLGVLAACAGRTGDSAGFAPASELSGTWRGSFSEIGGTLYTNDGNVVLEIKEDGTFTATITPASGANNRARTSTWTGTVARKGNRVRLLTAQGPWITLARRGDSLYGVTNDPTTEATVTITLVRGGGQA